MAMRLLRARLHHVDNHTYFEFGVTGHLAPYTYASKICQPSSGARRLQTFIGQHGKMQLTARSLSSAAAQALILAAYFARPMLPLLIEKSMEYYARLLERMPSAGLVLILGCTCTFAVTANRQLTRRSDREFARRRRRAASKTVTISRPRDIQD
ncbi:uncharacterized protein L969DRAFT_50751 [Mixia osmundae IAM 14324]|uniref:Uncharacterized protein n=1 Tax=Mixia osmundae (strain CBS 9802 / IAM 14324 / JCM 22182 / KY 12970) TaxID=764103 RepID=G7DZ89_MIXOS|nr:uncharacterized protein L969DRAFT_50751 [Mixia osmundae IAM 14324]KEI38301.1 hypothetical protein L969DRAFT_50751 [Mixia osmundae IAM 14324]GAA95899.1 hypothetical protein E5Q_02557 [Mixia osmundae IAM 14324]